MNLTNKQLSTLETTIENFIYTYQILHYDYEDYEQADIAFFMERLENAHDEEGFILRDMVDISENLFLSYPLQIDFKMLEDFNASVENRTVTFEEVTPVYELLDALFSDIAYYFQDNMIEWIENIEEYYNEYFFNFNYELEQNLKDNSDYIKFTLDYDRLIEEGYDPEVHEINGHYYRIENTF